jgi:hypothetical protein
MPNLYRPLNRENKFMNSYATSTSPVGSVGDTTPYSTSARISSYIIPKINKFTKTPKSINK